jgi:hypothetical protein
MAFNDRNWDELIESIRKPHSVAVIVGLDLLGTADASAPVPFYQELAAHTIEALRDENINISAGTNWTSFIEEAQMRTATVPARLTEALDGEHKKLLRNIRVEDIPEPLRLLAKISDLDLVITTTVDGLTAKAFGLAPDGTIKEAEHGENGCYVSSFDRCANLAGWVAPERGDPPTLVHLFGLINRSCNFALTEEDTLEFVCRLQNENRPESLLAELRRRSVLVLGTRFPDWLARFFLRALRGDRLSGRGRARTFEALADPEIKTDKPLVAFLGQYSPRTRVFDKGSTADFVRELYRRWSAAAPSSLTDVPEGVIFISYAREDGAAAKALCTALEAKHLTVWMDVKKASGDNDHEERLCAGDDYEKKIKTAIKQCSLFVPVLSHTTIVKEGYFRREFQWAGERLEIMPDRPFIVPIIVDDTRTGDHKDIPNYFQPHGRKVHVIRVLGGAADDLIIKDIIRALRMTQVDNAVGVVR